MYRNLCKRKISTIKVSKCAYLFNYLNNNINLSEGVKNVKYDITKVFYKKIISNAKYNNNELLKSIYNYFNKIIKKN